MTAPIKTAATMAALVALTVFTAAWLAAPVGMIVFALGWMTGGAVARLWRVMP